jgi:general L-amino acid transport system substrate-binding protein
MKRFSFVLAMIAVFALIGSASAGTLDDVKAKGFIQAGVNGDLFGFGKPDEKGVWKGLDVDTARAIAAAVFGDADKVKYTPLTAKTRFTALQSGEIDVLDPQRHPHPEPRNRAGPQFCPGQLL